MVDDVEVDIPASVGHPRFSGKLGRVSVILGANGSGKSRILNYIKANFGSLGLGRKVIFVEGGRVVTPPNNVKLTRQNFEPFQTLASARETRNSKLHDLLSSRVTEAFLFLKKLGDEIDYEFARHADEWNRNGQVGEFPERPMAPLQDLFGLFHDVFPEIILTLESESLEIKCEKNGNRYSPSDLSDGEKQALCLLADIALLSDDDSLIIVDEPELNLHPHLSDDLWNAIESRYPDCRFIYATHSISFALRSHVDSIFVLNRTDQETLTVQSPIELPDETLRPFLGSIPAILASDRCLVVEGEYKSFDSLFYKAILGSKGLVVEPLGGSKNVVAAASGSGLWEKISPTSRIVGIVDRDFKSEEKIQNTEHDRVIILEYHESESYFCIPKLLFDLGNAIGTAPTSITEDEIVERLVGVAEERLLHVVAKRVFERLVFPVRPSLDRRIVERLDSVDALVGAIVESRDGQLAKAREQLSDEVINALCGDEWKRCKSSLDGKDVEEILKIFEGKYLLGKLYPLSMCGSPEGVVRGCAKHLDLRQYPPFGELVDRIEAKLA